MASERPNPAVPNINRAINSFEIEDRKLLTSILARAGFEIQVVRPNVPDQLDPTQTESGMYLTWRISVQVTK